MCGHVGIAGKITINDEKVFRTLLILDSLRGEHSTGVAFVPKTGDAQLVKQVGDPFNLFNERRWDLNMRAANRVLLGHNRFATQGKINKANAHPFEFEDIIGAHNGTLTQRWKLHKNNTFDVDSMALFNHIDMFGVQDAINSIVGAWALVWWNKKEETLNFLRNGERTLYYCQTVDNSTIYWASEAWMLEVALSRFGVKHNPVGLLKEDTHISIPVDDKGVLGKGVVETVEAPKVLVPTSTKHVSVIGTASGTTTKTTALVPATKPPFVVEQPKKDFTPAAGTAPFPDGYMGSKNRVYELIEKGMDEAGSTYYLVSDPADLKDEVKIRMYVRMKNDYEVGMWVEASIDQWSAKDGGYFKLSASSVKVVASAGDVQDEKDEMDEQVETMKKKYSHYCAWCSSDIDFYELANKYNPANGDVICPKCVVNPEVSQYLN